MRSQAFHFGEWLIDSSTCTIRRDIGAQPVSVEPRAMDVLVALCSRAGDIVSAGDLLSLCWDGVVVGENQVHKAIGQLRRVLTDTAGHARYIENIRKRGYRTVAEVRALASVSAGRADESWLTRSPFVGLDAFGESHAAVFFGRDACLADLKESLFAQVVAGRAFLLVLGPSGSGKTSLVRAGLLPALRGANPFFRPVDAVSLDLGEIGGLPLLTALGSALLDLEEDGQPLLRGHSADRIAALLETAEAPALQALFGLTAVRAVLFIDRLEAIFHDRTSDETQRRRFLAALDRLARCGAIVVIAACRNDFYPDIARETLLMEGKTEGAHFDLVPPTRAEISQMIRLPALAAGLAFGLAPGTREPLDDMLVEATAGNPDALPLLQYTLQELFLQRSTSRELTVAAYRELGGLEGAIGRRAEAALTSLPVAAQASLGLVLPLIVTVGPQDEAVGSRRASWSLLATEEERLLVRTLVEHRLFVSSAHGEDVIFGVAHEALLRQWQRVTAWIVDHRQALNTRSRLEGAARRWIAEGRRTDLLLARGKPIEEARDLANQPGIPLTPEVASFVAASARRLRQADRRRVALAGAFAMLALAAVLLGLHARHEENIAEQRTHQAEELTNYMVGDLADKLRPLGRLDLLSDIGGKALGYFGDARPDKLSAVGRRQQARALHTLAEVARAHADPQGARNALVLAKRLLETDLAGDGGNAELLKDIGANAFWLGQIALDQGRLDDAQSAFEDYRRYSERMMAIEPDNVDAWVEMSYAFTNLGSVAKARGDHEAARAAFEQSIALKRRALERHPEDRNLRAGLANSLSWLGSDRQAIGELRPALDLFDQETAELRTLKAAAPSEETWSYRLSAALRRRAQLLADLGEATAAVEELRAAQLLAETLLRQDPSNQLWMRSQLNIDTNIGRILGNLGRLPDALKLQSSTADRLARLTAQDSANKAWRVLETTNLEDLAQTLLLLGRPADARRTLETTLDRMPTIGGGADQTSARALGLILMAQARRSLGENGDQACREAVGLLEPMLAADPLDSRDLLVRAYLCLGQRDQAGASIAWLAEVGYRDAGYARFLSQNH